MHYYDEIAIGYEELYREEQQRKLAVILNTIKLKKSDLLLDVGCGTGLSTKVWDCEKIGLDPAFGLLQRAHGAFFVNGEAEHIPFKDKSFDVIISITAIQNFHDIRQGLEEIKRVGKRSFILSFLKKSDKAGKIQKYISKLFFIDKILHEDKDTIYVVKRLCRIS